AGRLIAACAHTRDRTDATVSLDRPRPTRHVARRGRSLAGRALGPRCSGRSFGRRSTRSFARRSRRSFARLRQLEDAPLAATRGALLGAGIHEAVLALRRAGAARGGAAALRRLARATVVVRRAGSRPGAIGLGPRLRGPRARDRAEPRP